MFAPPAPISFRTVGSLFPVLPLHACCVAAQGRPLPLPCLGTHRALKRRDKVAQAGGLGIPGHLPHTPNRLQPCAPPTRGGERVSQPIAHR